jgi:hypothetical protein
VKLRKPGKERCTEGVLSSWLTLQDARTVFPLCYSGKTRTHNSDIPHVKNWDTELVWGSGSYPVQWTVLGNLWSRAVAGHDGTCLQFQHLRGRIRKTRSLGGTWATWTVSKKKKKKKIEKSSSWRLVDPDYHYNTHIVPYMYTWQSSLVVQSDGILCACTAWLCSPRRQSQARLKGTMRRQCCGSDPGGLYYPCDQVSSVRSEDESVHTTLRCVCSEAHLSWTLRRREEEVPCFTKREVCLISKMEKISWQFKFSKAKRTDVVQWKLKTYLKGFFKFLLEHIFHNCRFGLLFPLCYIMNMPHVNVYNIQSM